MVFGVAAQFGKILVAHSPRDRCRPGASSTRAESAAPVEDQNQGGVRARWLLRIPVNRTDQWRPSDLTGC